MTQTVGRRESDGKGDGPRRAAWCRVPPADVRAGARTRVMRSACSAIPDSEQPPDENDEDRAESDDDVPTALAKPQSLCR